MKTLLLYACVRDILTVWIGFCTVASISYHSIRLLWAGNGGLWAFGISYMPTGGSFAGKGEFICFLCGGFVCKP